MKMTDGMHVRINRMLMFIRLMTVNAERAAYGQVYYLLMFFVDLA